MTVAPVFPTGLDSFYDATTLAAHRDDATPATNAPGGTANLPETRSQYDERIGLVLQAIETRIGWTGDGNATSHESRIVVLESAGPGGGGDVTTAQLNTAVSTEVTNRNSAISTQIATEVTNRNSAISTAINNLINSAPGTLDTLGEIAAQLASDESAVGALTTTIAGKVASSLYDANTILAATTDNTPAALTVGEQTLVGRITGGNIAALTTTQTRTLLSISNVDNTSDATKNAASVALTNKTGVSLATPTVTGGTMTGGKIDAAHIHLVQSYSQSTAPTDQAIGTAFLFDWTATLSDTGGGLGSASQTGFFGPIGMIAMKGAITYTVNQSFEGLGPIGISSQLIEQNVHGSARTIAPGWDFMSARIRIADGATVTLQGNDTRKGPASFIDNALYITKNTGTINGTTNGYEHISFLSEPFFIGTGELGTRVGYDVADINGADNNAPHPVSEATQVALLGSTSFGSGIDSSTGTISNNIGIRIGTLTRGTTNIGIQNAASYVGWDGTKSHGAIKLLSSAIGPVNAASIGLYDNYDDGFPLIGISALGTAGAVGWGPGGSSGADVTLTRTATGVVTMVGAFEDAKFLTTADGTHGVFVTDGTATDGQIVFNVANLLGAQVAGISLYKSTADTAATLSLQSVNGSASLQMGPGGSSGFDVTLTRMGAGVATVVGTLTIPAPVITGHPTIEGVVSTGAIGSGKIVFSISPTFTGTLSAAAITGTGNFSTTGGSNVFTSTETSQTGAATIMVGNISTAPLTTIGVQTAAADTRQTVYLQDLNGTPSINFGVGGTTGADAKIERSGANLSPVLTVTGQLAVATGLTMADAKDIVIGTTTGTKIGTGTTQKISLYGVTPIVQRAGAAQAAVGTTAPAGGTGTAAGGWSTAGNRDTAIATINSCVTLVNELRAWAVAFGAIKGAA